MVDKVEVGSVIMQYAIELYYDKETESELFKLAKRVADEKVCAKQDLYLILFFR